MEQIKEFVNKNSQTIMYVGGGLLVLLVLWHVYTTWYKCRQTESTHIDQDKLIADINTKIKQMDLSGCGCGGSESSPKITLSGLHPENFGNDNFY